MLHSSYAGCVSVGQQERGSKGRESHEVVDKRQRLTMLDLQASILQCTLWLQRAWGLKVLQ